MSVPQKYITAIEKSLKYCESCQPRDREESDGFFWIHGERIGFYDFLEEINVPNKYFDEIDEMFSCPSCGQVISLSSDIGLETEYEREYTRKYKLISTRLAPMIVDFSEYISKYPYLGASHSIGKRLIKEIKAFPKIRISDKLWYRARRISGDKVFSKFDMCAPDPEKGPIGEGRFNHYGQSHLYLGDSEELCHREIASELSSLTWMQKVVIKKSDNIIDLSGYLSQDALDNIPLVYCGIMDSRAISKTVLRDKNWKPEYFVSRYIADVCIKNGISGIKYSSTIAYGDNIVLFKFGPSEIVYNGNPYIYKLKKARVKSIILEDVELF